MSSETTAVVKKGRGGRVGARNKATIVNERSTEPSVVKGKKKVAEAVPADEHDSNLGSDEEGTLGTSAVSPVKKMGRGAKPKAVAISARDEVFGDDGNDDSGAEKVVSPFQLHPASKRRGTIFVPGSAFTDDDSTTEEKEKGDDNAADSTFDVRSPKKSKNRVVVRIPVITDADSSADEAAGSKKKKKFVRRMVVVKGAGEDSDGDVLEKKKGKGGTKAEAVASTEAEAKPEGKQTGESAADPDEPVAKEERGRGKKVEVDQTETKDHITTAEENSADDQTDEPIIRKKGRGRAKKVAAEETEPKQQQGQDVKVADDSVGQPSVDKPKGKGRPKKGAADAPKTDNTKPANEENLADDSSEEPPLEKPKGRGRSKKGGKSTEEKSAQDSDQPLVEKPKGRGRPKKAAWSESTEHTDEQKPSDDLVDEPAVTKGKGAARGKKATGSKKPEQIVDEDCTDEIIAPKTKKAELLVEAKKLIAREKLERESSVEAKKSVKMSKKETAAAAAKKASTDDEMTDSEVVEEPVKRKGRGRPASKKEDDTVGLSGATGSATNAGKTDPETSSSVTDNAAEGKKRGRGRPAAARKDAEPAAVPAKKRGRAKAAEVADDAEDGTAQPDSDTVDAATATVVEPAKKRGRVAAAKTEPVSDDKPAPADQTNEKKTKGGRVAKKKNNV